MILKKIRSLFYNKKNSMVTLNQIGLIWVNILTHDLDHEIIIIM
jgi:hypothetical protein